MHQFTDPRLVALNGESGLVDSGMRAALQEALEPTEIAVASYNVSAHIWFEAVLTDRALLLVKGAVRARVTRVPLPITVIRPPSESKPSLRVRTPHGPKTLWGSKLDPGSAGLVAAVSSGAGARRSSPVLADELLPTPYGLTLDETELRATPLMKSDTASAATSAPNPARVTRAQARRAAGPRPRKPRRPRVRKHWVGFAPSPTTWDMADNCVKCGRPLTDPSSRLARVGTKCIKIYGSQQRRIPNPAHSVWLFKKNKNQVSYIAQKAHVELRPSTTEPWRRTGPPRPRGTGFARSADGSRDRHLPAMANRPVRP